MDLKVITLDRLNHSFGKGELRKPLLFDVDLDIWGQELYDASKTELVRVRHQIGFIFQSHNLLSCLTVEQNVRMSLRLHRDISFDKRSEMTTHIWEEVGLGDRLNFYPDSLSEGQQPRVAIACALVSKPQLVLADEPTAALDSKSGRNIVEIMQQLAQEQGCTILLVTHDNRILDIAERIIPMEDGRLVRKTAML